MKSIAWAFAWVVLVGAGACTVVGDDLFQSGAGGSGGQGGADGGGGSAMGAGASQGHGSSSSSSSSAGPASGGNQGSGSDGSGAGPGAGAGPGSGGGGPGCGDVGETCCDEDECASGARCLESGCVRCGGAGQACCGGLSSCSFSACATLVGEQRCYVVQFNVAGGNCKQSGVCPTGSICLPDAGNNQAYCIACGSFDEPCCPGKTCSGSWSCEASRCR